MQHASGIVYKEQFLTAYDLGELGYEQSALIDMLVMRKSASLVGTGASTFSFYLSELRLMDGLPQNSTQLLATSVVDQLGRTDELFYGCAVIAVQARRELEAKGLLRDRCLTRSGQDCFGESKGGMVARWKQ